MSRIIVVEDEPAIAELIAINLRHAGHEVTLAATAEQARLAIDAELPDLVVLDWMLPGQSGLSLARQWRGSERTRELPIIMLTARGEEGDKIAGLDAGADDYLTKPFECAELVARLRALIRRDNRLQTSVVTVGDLSIDLRARRVSRAGVEIELRRREYELLEFLVLRRGKIVSQSEILAHLCDEERELTSNVVDVHMSRLRARIERGFACRLIRTVRGLGYVFEAT